MNWKFLYIYNYAYPNCAAQPDHTGTHVDTTSQIQKLSTHPHPRAHTRMCLDLRERDSVFACVCLGGCACMCGWGGFCVRACACTDTARRVGWGKTPPLTLKRAWGRFLRAKDSNFDVHDISAWYLKLTDEILKIFMKEKAGGGKKEKRKIGLLAPPMGQDAHRGGAKRPGWAFCPTLVVIKLSFLNLPWIN